MARDLEDKRYRLIACSRLGAPSTPRLLKLTVPFQQINSHKSILRTFKKGARIVRMPRLACMSEVTDRGLRFEDAMNGKLGSDGRNLALLDRPRVRKWWTRDFPEMIRSIPSDWLPEMVDRGSADRMPAERESTAAE